MFFHKNIIPKRRSGFQGAFFLFWDYFFTASFIIDLKWVSLGSFDINLQSHRDDTVEYLYFLS